jgi:hypothetical protein
MMHKCDKKKLQKQDMPVQKSAILGKVYDIMLFYLNIVCQVYTVQIKIIPVSMKSKKFP